MPPPRPDHGQTAPLRRYPAADAVLHIGFGDTVEHLGEGQVPTPAKWAWGQFDAHVFKGVEAPHLGAVHPSFSAGGTGLVHPSWASGPLASTASRTARGSRLAARRHQGAAG